MVGFLLFFRQRFFLGLKNERKRKSRLQINNEYGVFSVTAILKRGAIILLDKARLTKNLETMRLGFLCVHFSFGNLVSVGQFCSLNTALVSVKVWVLKTNTMHFVIDVQFRVSIHTDLLLIKPVQSEWKLDFLSLTTDSVLASCSVPTTTPYVTFNNNSSILTRGESTPSISQ